MVLCRYRARLEAVLPEIFVSFNATYKAADSRMVQEALKRAVLRLLRVWRERFIFNDDYINGLQVRFVIVILLHCYVVLQRL
jgi:U2-associated protein SR140